MLTGKRLFFALWPDDTTRAAIVDRTGAAVTHCGGRKVQAPNLHLTLAFLHTVDTGLMPCVVQAATRAATCEFDLELTHVGAWHRSRILWLAPNPDRHKESHAAELASRLWRELAACGFTPERRPFRPHVTLARKLASVPQSDNIEPVRWRAHSFALVESTNAGAHPRYQVLQTFSLSDG